MRSGRENDKKGEVTSGRDQQTAENHLFYIALRRRDSARPSAGSSAQMSAYVVMSQLSQHPLQRLRSCYR